MQFHFWEYINQIYWYSVTLTLKNVLRASITCSGTKIIPNFHSFQTVLWTIGHVRNMYSFVHCTIYYTYFFLSPRL
jgi:hypothetical protein